MCLWLLFMPIHVFQKKLNYAKNISESCYNGNAKLLNVLKFYFDLKERHDKLYNTVKKYRLLIYHDLQIWMIWKKWDIRKFLTWHAFMNRFSFYFSCMIYFYDEMHITCFYNKYCIFVSGCFLGGLCFRKSPYSLKGQKLVLFTNGICKKSTLLWSKQMFVMTPTTRDIAQR